MLYADKRSFLREDAEYHASNLGIKRIPLDVELPAHKMALLPFYIVKSTLETAYYRIVNSKEKRERIRRTEEDALIEGNYPKTYNPNGALFWIVDQKRRDPHMAQTAFNFLNSSPLKDNILINCGAFTCTWN